MEKQSYAAIPVVLEKLVIQIPDFTFLRPYTSKDKRPVLQTASITRRGKVLESKSTTTQKLIVLLASLESLSMPFPMSGAWTVCLSALSCLKVTQILWTTFKKKKKSTSMPNKHFKSLNVSSGLILVQFIEACLLLELIICAETVLEVNSSPD